MNRPPGEFGVNAKPIDRPWKAESEKGDQCRCDNQKGNRQRSERRIPKGEWRGSGREPAVSHLRSPVVRLLTALSGPWTTSWAVRFRGFAGCGWSSPHELPTSRSKLIKDHLVRR